MEEASCGDGHGVDDADATVTYTHVTSDPAICQELTFDPNECPMLESVLSDPSLGYTTDACASDLTEAQCGDIGTLESDMTNSYSQFCDNESDLTYNIVCGASDLFIFMTIFLFALMN